MTTYDTIDRLERELSEARKISTAWKGLARKFKTWNRELASFSATLVMRQHDPQYVPHDERVLLERIEQLEAECNAKSETTVKLAAAYVAAVARVETLELGYKPLQAAIEEFLQSGSIFESSGETTRDDLEQLVLTLAMGIRFAFEFGEVDEVEKQADPTHEPGGLTPLSARGDGL